VVTIDGYEGKWLNISKDGIFYPEFLKVLPENCTIEMGIGTSQGFSVNGDGLVVRFIADRSNLLNGVQADIKGKTELRLHPAHESSRIDCYDVDGNLKMSNRNKQQQWTEDNPIAKLSIWRQKTRIRVYLNEEKIWDIPRAFESGVDYRMIFERNFYNEGNIYLSSVRLAEGKPDTRSKLITEGKFVTRGITFDVGSASIKPESYPVLKEIAEVLESNPEVRIKIIGHTDSDGNAASNLELSKKRAAAVAGALHKDFGIDQSRMKTDGRGDTEPSEPNTSAKGKANNRRVEFVNEQ
jgi:outer membrane protein OmpA-like peptidoglycan-associated protein